MYPAHLGFEGIAVHIPCMLSQQRLSVPGAAADAANYPRGSPEVWNDGLGVFHSWTAVGLVYIRALKPAHPAECSQESWQLPKKGTVQRSPQMYPDLCENQQ